MLNCSKRKAAPQGRTVTLSVEENNLQQVKLKSWKGNLNLIALGTLGLWWAKPQETDEQNDSFL